MTAFRARVAPLDPLDGRLDELERATPTRLPHEIGLRSRVLPRQLAVHRTPDRTLPSGRQLPPRPDDFFRSCAAQVRARDGTDAKPPMGW